MRKRNAQRTGRPRIGKQHWRFLSWHRRLERKQPDRFGARHRLHVKAARPIRCFVAFAFSFGSEVAMVPPIPLPTPTCVRFRVIEMPCTKCSSQMRLILSEPQSKKFDLATYRRIACQEVESFLMAI